MSGPIVYVDNSDVRAGALEELKVAIKGLTDFIEANEPQLIAYNIYFNDRGTRMTVVNLHADSASLEYHMDVAGPAFRKFVDLVTLSSIDLYGEPSRKILGQLHQKAQLLGNGTVTVHKWHAGFTRFNVR
jgi:hypothetical protein